MTDPKQFRVTACTEQISDDVWGITATVEGKIVESRMFKGTREDAKREHEAMFLKWGGAKVQH